MIIGVFLRYFKTYQGINYIPITDEDEFCGLVGNNGVGKSSVLEALDCFFNQKEWNLNIATRKSGTTTTTPYICPVFLIKKTDITSNKTAQQMQSFSEIAWKTTANDTLFANKDQITKFINHRNLLARNIDTENHYLLPIGIDHNGNISISIFNSVVQVKELLKKDNEDDTSKLDAEQINTLRPILNEILKLHEYIYIPREIDPESFTKLETKEIQILMGESLIEVLNQRVTKQQITNINRQLNDFLDNLSNELDGYAYRTPTSRQQQLRRSDVHNLIIQAFFSVRKLHKNQNGNWLEISHLSSGEKQKAIIHVAENLLKKHRKSGNNLIIAVDEPESSLHMSACFEQFETLYKVSRYCKQVIFASHWYGFLPSIETGSATMISKENDTHQFDQINLSSHREQIKQMKALSKGQLPYDIRLKSINDLVQSIIASSIGQQPYNWIICEGTSEKNYFSKYFEDLIDSKKLRIIPVGGAPEIKRIYNYLATAYEDFKNEITGKIILISDTDANLVTYNVTSNSNLICKRIVNCLQEKKTKLVPIHSNIVSPATDIELALNGKLFHEALHLFTEDYPDDLGFLLNTPKTQSEGPSYFALDLRQSEWASINSFLNKDNNKYNLSLRYSELVKDTHKTPEWIDEIKSWLI